MATDPNSGRSTTDPFIPDEGAAPENGDAADFATGLPEEGIASEPKVAVLPDYEVERPDPVEPSEERMGLGSLALAALAAASILGVVLYGLNSTPPAPPEVAQQTAPPAPAPAPAPGGGGSAPQAAPPAPAAGGGAAAPHPAPPAPAAGTAIRPAAH